MNETDLRHVRAVIEVAREARTHGNRPFGALLADERGDILLRAENTVAADGDCTGHAEANLVRLASARLSPEVLARCTLYASTEPCAMCAGAIYWSQIGRVVYALGIDRLAAHTGAPPELPIHCREILARGRRPTEVLGPALEDEAIAVFSERQP
jgi:tRNA(Arg) A34 adenosine deaminase TadA